jgi:hypothetical protein
MPDSYPVLHPSSSIHPFPVTYTTSTALGAGLLPFHHNRPTTIMSVSVLISEWFRGPLLPFLLLLPLFVFIRQQHGGKWLEGWISGGVAEGRARVEPHHSTHVQGGGGEVCT